MGNSNDGKKLMWYNLGLMAFVSVWGFGNVVNNFATINNSFIFRTICTYGWRIRLNF